MFFHAFISILCIISSDMFYEHIFHAPFKEFICLVSFLWFGNTSYCWQYSLAQYGQYGLLVSYNYLCEDCEIFYQFYFCFYL